MTLLLTAAATFMAFLDTTVVNVAFPDLRTDFPHESLTNLTWVVTSYGVLFAALLTPRDASPTSSAASSSSSARWWCSAPRPWPAPSRRTWTS